jgi:Domain of unknown function (DUF1707)
MDDRLRISDADREQVTARLREHYAEGRLTSEELDERITAALSAKTFGDLRRIMADLPEPAPAGAQGGPPPGWAGPGWAGPGRAGPGWAGPQSGPVPPGWAGPGYRYRRGPGLLPLVLLVLFLAIILPPAGFVLFAFLKVIFLIFLVTCLFGIFAAARFRRHARRNWQGGNQGQRRHWE